MEIFLAWEPSVAGLYRPGRLGFNGLSDDRNVLTSNIGSFQVRHRGCCFDPIYELQRGTRCVVGVSPSHVTFHACTGTSVYRLDK